MAYWEEKKKILDAEYLQLKSSASSIDAEIQTKTNNAEQIISSKIETLKERMEKSAQEMSAKYQEAEQDAKREYLEILKDFTDSCANAKTAAAELEKKLKILRSKHDAAVEEYKRAQEMSEKKDFYRLQLTEIDLEEIKKLREVEPYLRDPKPLNKVIWSVYYEHPYTDLIGRLIGRERKTGVYKLTNIQNNMVYVGQAVNISDRWKQHIKCAIGAENAPNNKLYPAMREAGPENFTFELLEECPQEELNEREQYWQEFYKAKEFGYSVR